MDEKLFGIVHKLSMENLYTAIDRFPQPQKYFDTSRLKSIKDTVIKSIPRLIELQDENIRGIERDYINRIFIAKTELIEPNGIYIIVKAETDVENKDVEKIFKKLIDKQFVKYNFSDVRITDYSNDENMHVAYIAVSEKYLK